MRNLFDQYTQPENRLTHALVTALAEDNWLLRNFIRWVTGKNPPIGRTLRIVEQQLPGDAELSEDDSERRGLPDAWIYDDEEWSILIELRSPINIAIRNLPIG